MKKVKSGTATQPVKKQGRNTKTGAPSTSASGARAAAPHEPLAKQPQSKHAAALATGMFLYTDDKWSLAYFDDNDLHNLERQVFG